MVIDIADWLENEIQQEQGSLFLQQSYTVSALLPVISSSILSRLNNAAWLEDEIRDRLGYQSFQQPYTCLSADVADVEINSSRRQPSGRHIARS